ncbi:hypothetical protein CKM354_000859300 [Cercospora kikuchii]|uniref:Uncharacterized protein n=1 Tax=Cercospora kikuchii TaxID=84275 RepID=A0A9P3CN43_9PEZI|nr:uncharacterized protein CKM354_000859300 [Cercospora kikuchii]GIZ45426.1 hypothetical protein CKM354_000859300 [Cercospora kikuchii]
MGAYIALSLRARGLISILLGIYGAFNPKEFFNIMISQGWEGKHSCDATLHIALGRAAMQHGWQLVALGALLLLLAGETSLHKTAASIAIFASSSAFGVYLGSEAPRGVAMYHLAWCFLHTVSYEVDRRKDKRQAMSNRTHKNEASSDEKAQPVF